MGHLTLTLLTLQEEAEYLFDDSKVCAIHTKHVTAIPEGMHLPQWIRGDDVRFEDGINMGLNKRNYPKETIDKLSVKGVNGKKKKKTIIIAELARDATTT